MTCLTLGVMVSLLGAPPGNKLQNGDIVFRGVSNKMLAAATGSPYTHCGIVFFEDNTPYVYEAVGPVKKTKYSSWIKGYTFVKVTRYPNLTKSELNAIKSYARSQLGKRYDKAYSWTDSKMYCSELVWKAYNNAGIKLCPLTKGSDYLASNIPAIKHYFISRGVSLDSYMVSPAAILKSNKLKTVH